MIKYLMSNGYSLEEIQAIMEEFEYQFDTSPAECVEEEFSDVPF